MSTALMSGNAVIDRLSSSHGDQLMGIGSRRPLDLGVMIHRVGEPTTNLVFPLLGMVSLTVPTPEGDNVEVALVGREGVVGLNAILGGDGDLQAIVQVAGEGVWVRLRDVPADLVAALRGAVGSYASDLMLELAQTAMCNRVHSVEERTARWLLHAADRAQTKDLNLTHEFLAMMLGVRRASVTVVVSGFESAGLITTERRRISIADHAGLEEYSCGCYAVVKAATAMAAA